MNQQSEQQLMNILMHEDSIEFACNWTCKYSKLSLPCENNMLCKNMFSRADGPVIIRYGFSSRFY